MKQDVFLIEVPMFPLSLVKIGQIVKKRQPCFEIQDGDGHHFELRLLRSVDDADDVFNFKVAIFLLNLAMIGQIINKLQLFFEIQDGGRHLVLWLLRFSDVTDVF